MGLRQVTLIQTDLEKRGTGTESDPHRRVIQYWTPDGELVFEDDPCKDRNLTAESVLAQADEMVKALEGSYFDLELPDGKHWDYLRGRVNDYRALRRRLI